MNPKSEGFCDVCNSFNDVSSGKPYGGWHGDIEETLAAFESQSPCKMSR